MKSSASESKLLCTCVGWETDIFHTSNWCINNETIRLKVMSLNTQNHSLWTEWLSSVWCLTLDSFQASEKTQITFKTSDDDLCDLNHDSLIIVLCSVTDSRWIIEHDYNAGLNSHFYELNPQKASNKWSQNYKCCMHCKIWIFS